MIEVALRKRKAAFKGEIGFYPVDQVAEEDTGSIALDSDTWHQISSPKNLAMMRYLWALVTLVSNNTECFMDKDDAMDQLKLKARFAKMVLDPATGKMELIPKSMRRLSNEQLLRLVNRIKHIVLTEVLPGIERKDMEREIEEMLR